MVCPDLLSLKQIVFGRLRDGELTVINPMVVNECDDGRYHAGIFQRVLEKKEGRDLGTGWRERSYGWVGGTYDESRISPAAPCEIVWCGEAVVQDERRWDEGRG